MNEKFTPKQVRLLIGLNQNEMAEKLGISTSAYVLKELGKGRFYFDEIQKICEMGKISIDKIKM